GLNPRTLSISARAKDATGSNNDAGYVRPSEWVSWNVQVPSTGDYQITAVTSGGGRLVVIVDGAQISEGASGTSVGGTVRLMPGIHSVRVQADAGEFSIRSIAVLRVGGPAAAAPVVVPPKSAGLPNGWPSNDIGSPS